MKFGDRVKVVCLDGVDKLETTIKLGDTGTITGMEDGIPRVTFDNPDSIKLAKHNINSDGYSMFKSQLELIEAEEKKVKIRFSYMKDGKKKTFNVDDINNRYNKAGQIVFCSDCPMDSSICDTVHCPRTRKRWNTSMPKKSEREDYEDENS